MHPTRPVLRWHSTKGNPVVVDRVWNLLDPEQKRAAFRVIVEVGCRMIGAAAVNRIDQGGSDEYR
ncbi:MAG: hypothetical protein SXV54_26395 [Chloroflexota bacterium]|nr:hypothetical protein [Chloroflexota bacterium]